MIRRYFHVKWTIVGSMGEEKGERFTLLRLFPWQSLVRRLGSQMIQYHKETGNDIIPTQVTRV